VDPILFPDKRKPRHAPPPAEPDLFDEQPAWVAVPETDLERRFVEFHRANPKVYAALEAKCLALFEQGRTRIGVAELVEDLRYDQSLKTAGDQFKINNSFRSFYARLLIYHHSKLASVIGIREQTHAQAKAAQ
jgi:hypothetical protein